MTVIPAGSSFEGSIEEDVMKKSLSVLLQQHREEAAVKDDEGRRSVFADAVQLETKHPVNLDILTFKVPVPVMKNANRPLHPKINRFPLPHALSDGRTSVLLVTKDVKKQKADLTNAHYLEILTNSNCNHLVTEIVTVQQLKDEYNEKEALEDLCARTDVVLCEKAVVNIVPRLLGKSFLIAKKHPMAVNLQQSNLQKQITKILSLTSHKMTFRNTQSSLPFGRVKQGVEQLEENLKAALQYLSSSQFHGGWANVKALYLTLGLKTRVPLYVSTGLSNDVPKMQIEKKMGEVFEGDFGFGYVKITDKGVIIDYSPLSDDEDAPVVLKDKLAKRKRPSSKVRQAAKKAKLEVASVTSNKRKKLQRKASVTKKTTAAKKISGTDKAKKFEKKLSATKKDMVGKKASPTDEDKKFDKKPSATKKDTAERKANGTDKQIGTVLKKSVNMKKLRKQSRIFTTQVPTGIY
uniref:Ribosomal L1 domain-containing protein CG13096-like n=1 Tax=Hirondellea gigas TaxID=1518452 RepID=A0A2P2I5A3_9CRUS